VHMLQHAQNPKKWNSQFWENIHHSSSTYWIAVRIWGQYLHDLDHLKTKAWPILS
jgi:hypothetical protein